MFFHQIIALLCGVILGLWGGVYTGKIQHRKQGIQEGVLLAIEHQCNQEQLAKILSDTAMLDYFEDMQVTP